MTDTEKFELGERLRIVVEGVVTYVGGTPDVDMLVDCGAGVRRTEIPIGAPGITVERLAPALVPGRVYRDSFGDLVYAYTAGADRVSVVWPDGTGHLVADIPKNYLPLTPARVLLDAEPDAPGDDISWPPKRAGLRYRDKDRSIWESVEFEGGLRACHLGAPGDSDSDPGNPLKLSRIAESWGPMTPLGGVS